MPRSKAPKRIAADDHARRIGDAPREFEQQIKAIGVCGKRQPKFRHSPRPAVGESGSGAGASGRPPACWQELSLITTARQFAQVRNRVGLIQNLDAEQSLNRVFHGDQAGRAAIFIDHEGIYGLAWR